MISYKFLLFLAIILISTKILGLFSRKVKMPAVVGALVAGIILGPSVLNLISSNGNDSIFLEMVAEVGVIFLMFNAGLETDLDELKKNCVASLVTATIGVIVPLLGGIISYALYFNISFDNYTECLKAVFTGVVLTATSVSITVETLNELGKLKGKVGTTILGAAIIDDIIGIIVLTIVTSLNDKSSSPSKMIIKILLYFVFIGIVAFIIFKLRKYIEKADKRRRTVIIAVSFCFLLSYISERYFGIADITGAYFAGMMLSYMKNTPYIYRRVEIPSYLFFSPVFFASIGFKTSMKGMTASMVGFSLILLAVAIITKIIGCGFGAKMCKCTSKESLQIGIGMISRGEVALIVAQKGYQCGMLNKQLFAPVILVVIVTTLITPILLKIVMKNKEQKKLATVN